MAMQPHRQGVARRSTRQLTVEEFRLSDPRVSRLLELSPLADHTRRFRARLAAAESVERAGAIAEAEGLSLWRAACAGAAASLSDDRALYWVRLQLTAYLRSRYAPRFALRSADRAQLIARFEQASRGLSELQFSASAADKRILISGFDPFRLDTAADRSNPSGAAALFLDGKYVGHGTRRAQVRAVIFPVRFRDFDGGLVETTFRPFLEPEADGSTGVDLLVTISQNNSEGYEIEHWAGRRRTLEASDNLGQFGAHTTTRGTSEIVPLGAAGEHEFEQTSLPVEAMLRAAGALGGDHIRENMSRLPAQGGPAVRGSGGNYLSNEVFYRAASLERTTRRVAAIARAAVPVGHLHVPLMEPPHALTDPVAYAARRQEIASHVKAILTAALSGL